MKLIYIIRRSFVFAHKDLEVLLVVCLVQILMGEQSPSEWLNIFRFDKYRLYMYVIII